MRKKLKKKETLYAGKWLLLERIFYKDKRGNIRQWEACARSAGRGAVMVMAMLKPSSRIVLVRQYRPPAASYVMEFPAGLMEDRESPSETAMRELHEECGLFGEVISIHGPFLSSPGMTSETVFFVMMEIDENSSRAFEQPDPDEDEDLETFFVPLGSLADFLCEREGLGDKIDAKLAAAAMMLPIASGSPKKTFVVSQSLIDVKREG